jgi:hypothetical protein
MFAILIFYFIIQAHRHVAITKQLVFYIILKIILIVLYSFFMFTSQIILVSKFFLFLFDNYPFHKLLHQFIFVFHAIKFIAISLFFLHYQPHLENF